MDIIIINSVRKILKSQIATICSLKAGSMLGEKSPEALINFSWMSLYNEFKRLAPDLINLLEMCSQTKKSNECCQYVCCYVV